MIIIEILFEAIIQPLLSISLDLGYLIYDSLVPKAKDKDKISTAFNIVLAIFGSTAIGIVILAILMVFLH